MRKPSTEVAELPNKSYKSAVVKLPMSYSTLECLQSKEVSDDDPRFLLRGQQRLVTLRTIRKGTVLGPYGGVVHVNDSRVYGGR